MIQIKNLCFSYTNIQPYILDNINILIPNGAYVSIIGENGSAKSTFVKLLLGLLKPNRGTIELNTSKIGYVPQKLEGYNSQFPITVSEILNCHLKALKLKDKNIIYNNLELLSMYDKKDSLIGNLSGGQQQKVVLCRAMIGNPELLILDEPSTGIDSQSEKEIYNILYNLNQKLGITIFSVEHNLQAALNNSTHIFSLNKGKGNLYTIEDYRRLYSV